MKAIVISKGQITIGSDVINSLKYTAKLVNALIVIYSTVSENILCQGAAADLSLNGTTYATENEFIVAFNLAIQNANVDINLTKNTGYPDSLISANIVCTTKQQITTQAKPGYVTLSAPSTNTGVIYIGLTGVGVTSYPLAADKSIGLELADLSLIYVLASVGGERVNVLGAYKS
jgi:hypothetical protein